MKFEKVLEEMQLAQRLWLQEAKNSGFAIPPPQYKPLIYRVS